MTTAVFIEIGWRLLAAAVVCAVLAAAAVSDRRSRRDG
jgi:heme A synthase